MRRRRFLTRTASAAALAPWVGLGASGCASETPSRNVEPFQHGVASGDPLHDRVILWTRVSGSQGEDLPVDWWVADAQTGQRVAGGTEMARAATDFTVKVDATGLRPGRAYRYGFRHRGVDSTEGRTRTLPVTDAGRVRLAVTSCANYPNGYFNAYRHIAAIAQLDAVLCLGDYLYEYGGNTYGDGEALGRVPVPEHEIVTLADYRLRHAQYKADVDLQSAHAAHPWIVVWDDHESANNAWQDGAQNHNPDNGEGTWDARRAAAILAYYEWMPIRDVPTGLFRHFRFGNLADLVMLDTRLEGRDEQVAGDDHAGANAPSRSILGRVQEQRFLNHLSATEADGVQWKLVGQQVVFAPWTDGQGTFNADSWDGYRASRSRVLKHVKDGGIDGLVILTGDVHSAWGMEVPDVTGARHGIELVAPAVSSKPLATVSPAMHDLVASATDRADHIRYADGLNNGFLLVDVDAQRTQAEWYFTGARDRRDEPRKLGKRLESPAGSNRLRDPVVRPVMRKL